MNFKTPNQRNFASIVLALSMLFCMLFTDNILLAQDSPNIFYLKDSLELNMSYVDSIENEMHALIKQKHYEQAFPLLLKCIERHIIQENYTKSNSLRFLLSKIYSIFDWYPKSIAQAEFCQVYFRQAGEDLYLSKTLHHLAFLYDNIGDRTSAKYFLSQCDLEKKDANDPFCKYEHLLYESMTDTTIPSSTIRRNMVTTISYAKNAGASDLQMYAYALIGKTHLVDSNFNLALLAFEKSLKLSLAERHIAMTSENYRNLFVCLSQMNEYKKASDCLLQYTKYRDTSERFRSDMDINREILRFEKKEIRDEKIDLEQTKRLMELRARRTNFKFTSLLFTIGAILVAAFFVVLFYQQRLETSNIIHAQSEQINNQKIKELENATRIEKMKSMISGQEYERERIAKDLHDSLGGLLSTIRLRMDNLPSNQIIDSSPEMSKIHNLVDVACTEIRNISHNLRPGALENLGLKEAIRDMLNRFISDDGPEIILQHYGTADWNQIDPNVALQLYRIVQELVNNAVKHANSSEILVQLSLTDKELQVTVEDDGSGYDPLHVSLGSGLDNIQSRVNYISGEMHIDSRPDKGTSVLIVVPNYSAIAKA